jgi:hypothetical protein
MKQKDIALIMVIVFVSVILSLFISKAIFAKPSSRQQEVEVVQPLTASFPTKANNQYFQGGFDPAQLIQIAPNNNPNPFNAPAGN